MIFKLTKISMEDKVSSISLIIKHLFDSRSDTGVACIIDTVLFFVGYRFIYRGWMDA